jgi:hypothetical protein
VGGSKQVFLPFGLKDPALRKASSVFGRPYPFLDNQKKRARTALIPRLGHLSHSGIRPAASFASCYWPGVGKQGLAFFLSPLTLSFLVLVFCQYGLNPTFLTWKAFV